MIRTLLVDDDEAILHLFRTVLELDGFAVDLAISASEAILALAKETYDVVVTDLRMETNTAGFDVVRVAVQLIPRPLVVIVTAFPVPASEWRRTGADALYVKGSSMMGLPQQVKELLRLKQTRQGEAQNPQRIRRSR